MCLHLLCRCLILRCRMPLPLLHIAVSVVPLLSCNALVDGYRTAENHGKGDACHPYEGRESRCDIFIHLNASLFGLRVDRFESVGCVVVDSRLEG